MVDNATSIEIDKSIERLIKNLGLKGPPILIDEILAELRVNRRILDLEDPSFLKRCLNKLRIGGEMFSSLLLKLKLEGVWLPKERKILIASNLPDPKMDWASFHETIHRLLPWHRSFFFGDTARTLHPDYQEILEGEANYGASALMFGGKMFTNDALDTSPCWGSVKLLKERYKKSWVTTLRRYVGFSHNLPLAAMVSTPWWLEKPEDQETRTRHFVMSSRFKKEFGPQLSAEILEGIDNFTAKRRGGIVGEFELSLTDLNGKSREFSAEAFFNRHYILTFLHQK